MNAGFYAMKFSSILVRFGSVRLVVCSMLTLAFGSLLCLNHNFARLFYDLRISVAHRTLYGIDLFYSFILNRPMKTCTMCYCLLFHLAKVYQVFFAEQTAPKIRMIIRFIWFVYPAFILCFLLSLWLAVLYT